jgi:superfamily II DNA/RNA helicase
MNHEVRVTDQEAREGTGIARNQNVVYSLPHDRSVVAEFLAPALARVDAEQPDVQLLIITADAEEAVALADAASQLSEARPLRILAATNPARAVRLLRDRPAQVLVGSPRELLSLLKSSALKAEALKALVLAWADDILATGATAELEAVMAEVPKEAARTLVAGQLGEGVEAFIERYLRRARRVAPQRRNRQRGGPRRPSNMLR